MYYTDYITMYVFYDIVNYCVTILTLNLLDPSYFAFATSIEPGQPAQPCSLTRLYTDG